MSAAPDVSVVMPARNAARFLPAALDSVLGQTCERLEVILVDDGSDDGTGALARARGDRRVTVLTLPEPVGPAAARNHGLDIARAPYVAFLDGDDVARAERLAVQMAHARQSGAGLVAARVDVIDESGAATGATWGGGVPDALVPASLFFRNCLPTSTVLLDRAALAAERFDARLAVASDYDMWLRLAPRVRTACLPATLVWYRIHPRNLTSRLADRAEECLREIAARAMRRVGVAPTPTAVDVHRAISRRDFSGWHTTAAFERAASWLDSVETANRISRAYPVSAFRAVIADEWLTLCAAAAERGLASFCRTALRFRASNGDRAAGRLFPLALRAARRTIRATLPGTSR